MAAAVSSADLRATLRELARPRQPPPALHVLQAGGQQPLVQQGEGARVPAVLDRGQGHARPGLETEHLAEFNRSTLEIRTCAPLYVGEFYV